jgi:hypothetical protein
MRILHPKNKAIFATIACITMVISLALTSTLKAQVKPFKKFSVGVTAGTRGIGGEVATNLTKNINFRVALSGFSYSDSGEEVDEDLTIGYEGDASINALSFMVDYHPFNRGLKLVGGLVRNNFELNAFATPTEPYEFNEDKTFSPERLGSISARVRYPNQWMPYFGIGFGNSLAKGLPIKLNMSLGLLYSGAPELQMEGSGLIAPTVDQVVNFQQGLNEFEWYPVFKLGLSFRIIK